MTRGARVCAVLALCVPALQAATEPPRLTAADYAWPVRDAGGRVDVDATAARLAELGVATYYFLIAQPRDWEDLQAFLPKAAAAGIDV